MGKPRQFFAQIVRQLYNEGGQIVLRVLRLEINEINKYVAVCPHAHDRWMSKCRPKLPSECCGASIMPAGASAVLKRRKLLPNWGAIRSTSSLRLIRENSSSGTIRIVSYY